MCKRSLKHFFSLLCCLFLIVGCKTDTDIVNEPLEFESKSNTTIFNVWDMVALTSTDSKVQVQMNLSEFQGEHPCDDYYLEVVQDQDIQDIKINEISNQNYQTDPFWINKKVVQYTVSIKNQDEDQQTFCFGTASEGYSIAMVEEQKLSIDYDENGYMSFNLSFSSLLSNVSNIEYQVNVYSKYRNAISDKHTCFLNNDFGSYRSERILFDSIFDQAQGGYLLVELENSLQEHHYYRSYKIVNAQSPILTLNPIDEASFNQYIHDIDSFD